MDIVIKNLDKDSDIEKVKEFLFKMIKLEFGYDYVPEWHQDIVNIDEYYINPKRNNMFVAYNEENDEIIATIGIRAYDKNFPQFKHLYSNENTASIWRLFVDRRYRRCGLASKMFNVAENFAATEEYSEIYLHTHKTLEGALSFWTKMGFITTIDEEDELETVHMDKKISKIDLNAKAFDYTYVID